jgi:hypothetical protein
MKKIIFISLSVLLGAIFIFSAYIKLFPVELFELTFVDLGIANWFTAPFIARIMIAIEFFIGFLLLFNLYRDKFTLRFTIGILIFFTIYLLWQLIAEGNSGNCKCLGNFISLTPLESIIKNIILIAFALLLYKYHKGIIWKYSKIFFFIIILTSTSLPFIINPIDLDATEQNSDDSVLNYKLDLDVLYNNPKVVEPKIDLRKGKYIISFMSLTCPYCRIGAYKLHIIKKRNPDIPIFFILNGDTNRLKPFFDETKAINIPYTILLGQNFIKMSGLKLPAIYWVNNSIVIRKSTYINLDQKAIEDWLK